MGLIETLQTVINQARLEYESAEAGNFRKLMNFKSGEKGGLLVKGDNLEWMKHMEEAGYGGKVNLIYVDPPFFSKSNYDNIIKIGEEKIKLGAYNDVWENGMEDYLRMLCVRFYMMRDLLADDGCMWVHLDWHVVHYVKILLDEIFGEKNFINEIIWNYKSGGTSKKRFARKHDTLLFYTKTGKYYFRPQLEKSYNREFKPYRFKGVREYKDDVGWYTMVNMKDVWQIDMVGRTAAERTGYATQKPETLIERIVESCSKEGDLCADFFGGSGTLANVAHKMKRGWISCDAGNAAFSNSIKRLMKSGAAFTAIEQEAGAPYKAKGEVKVNISAEPSGLRGQNTLRVSLISYTPDLKTVSLPKASEKVVRGAMKADSLSLLDYWSVDFNFDGEIHRADAVLLAGEKEAAKMIKGAGGISIHVADVFGNHTFISEDR